MENYTKEDVKSMEVQAVIIRKDGTVEQLGTISYWHKSFFKRLFWNLKNFLLKIYGRT